MAAPDIVDRLGLLAKGGHLDLADIVCADAITEIERLRVSKINGIDLDEALRLIRQHMQPGDTLGKMFLRVARALEKPKRADLTKMLSAWKFWGEMTPDF